MDFLNIWKYNKHWNYIIPRVPNKSIIIMDTTLMEEVFKIAHKGMQEGK
jgi:hypothetical protein